MLVACAGSLAGNVDAQLDKALGELATTANDHCKILPPSTIRHHFSEHRVAGVPSAEVLGVLFKVPLGVLCPFSARPSFEVLRQENPLVLCCTNKTLGVLIISARRLGESCGQNCPYG